VLTISAQVAFLLLRGKYHISDSSEPIEDEDEIQSGCLERICNFFGRYSKDFALRLDESPSPKMWELVLVALNDNMHGLDKPFCNWNPAQIAPEDSTFIWSFIEKKDPLDRPTERELLKHKWFTT